MPPKPRLGSCYLLLNICICGVWSSLTDNDDEEVEEDDAGDEKAHEEEDLELGIGETLFHNIFDEGSDKSLRGIAKEISEACEQRKAKVKNEMNKELEKKREEVENQLKK